MQNGAKTASGTSAGPKKESLQERALDELKKYAVITLYLWVLFVLFATYKRMLLQENGISPWNQGFAIVNALIFGKVVLIAHALNLGRSLKDQALIWVVLGKSLLFTVVLTCSISPRKRSGPGSRACRWRPPSATSAAAPGLAL